MKRLLWLSMVLAVGCNSAEGSRVDEPKGPSEQEVLGALWAKVGPFEVSRTTTPEELIAALGQPVAHYSDPESYSWGKFNAADNENRVTRRTMFFAEFESGGLKKFRKTEPIFTHEAPLGYREGPLMGWDNKEKKFLPRGRRAGEETAKAKQQTDTPAAR
jgi:hypothetical protein